MLVRLPNQYFTEEQINTHPQFRVESHKVETEDGHFLVLQRIVPREEKSCTEPAKVVFMQHGLLETSGIFVLNDYSIAFLLASEGCDVWIGNNRTSHYGQERFTRPEDFSFSIDELIKYDFPAMVEYIAKHAHDGKIHFIGQSQGAGQCFAALSSIPTLRDKFAKCVLLSPAIFLKKSPSPWILKLLMSIPENWFGEAEFLPAIVVFSRIMPWQLTALAGKMFMSVMGFIEKEIGGESLYHRSKWFANIPTGCTSVNNVLHWLDMLRTGGCIRKFRQPPETGRYRIQEMLDEWSEKQADLKVHVFLGGRDVVIDVEKTESCFGKHPHICSVHIFDEYGHTDFVWSSKEHVGSIYSKIVQFITDE